MTKIDRLPDRADVDDDALLVEHVLVVLVLRQPEEPALRHDARGVRVAVEGAALHVLEDRVDLLRVEDVGREDVLARRVARRAVDVLDAVPLLRVDRERQVAEELPAHVAELGVVRLDVELLAGPVDRHLRLRVEPDGAVEHRLLVVAEEGELELRAGDVHAVDRVRAVADHVAEAEDLVGLVALDVLEDGGQRLDVGVEIADDGDEGHAGPDCCAEPVGAGRGGSASSMSMTGMPSRIG